MLTLGCLVALSQLPEHNTKFYFIYWCCFWHVPEHGVATRWLWCNQSYQTLGCQVTSSYQEMPTSHVAVYWRYIKVLGPEVGPGTV